MQKTPKGTPIEEYGVKAQRKFERQFRIQNINLLTIIGSPALAQRLPQGHSCPSSKLLIWQNSCSQVMDQNAFS